MSTKISLRFEYGAFDKTPVTVSGDWFQITYSIIRDSDDKEIAYRHQNGKWIFQNEYYSDIVLFAAKGVK